MLYYMFNKPPDCVSACSDGSKKTVLDYFAASERSRLHPVGRLDYDTRGLLIITDDGMVDQALLLPERHAVKKYFFYAIGEMTPEKAEILEKGVNIGGDSITRPAVFSLCKKMRVCDISEYLPERRRQKYLKNAGGNAFSGILEICEGKKHQVKLMLRAVNCRIVYLKRLEIGGIVLDEKLSEGKYRPLNDSELEILCRLENEIRINKITLEQMKSD